MKLGMPYYLIDRTGSLAGSDYIDLYQRLSLTIRCTSRDANHTVFMIFDDGQPCTRAQKALATLEFGPQYALGTISFPGTDGSLTTLPMRKYISKTSALGSSFKVLGSDGQEYKWKRYAEEGQDWTCTKTSGGQFVASYGSDPSGQDSQRILTLDEDFGHFGPDVLASLTIVRHIETYRL